MPILDIQRRGRQIGEIRIGMVVKTENGKTRPSKLDSFRFTCKSSSIAEAVAQLLGGEAHEATLQHGEKTYEVISSVTEIPVMVPPGDQVISQWNEQWSAGGCQRRCDGKTEQLSGKDCMCPADPEQRNRLAAKGNACKPTTRVNVMLPDLPDLGVWLLQSHGFYAAIELGGAAEVLAAAREQGVIIPAKLRLEQRQVTRDGQTKKFAVPVLEIVATLRQMTELSAGQDIAASLPPPPEETAALSAGLPTSPISSVQLPVSDPDDEPIEAEIVDDSGDGSLASEILGLDGKVRAAVDERMKKANFPPVSDLSEAAERQVRKWIAEIKAKGEPF